MMAWILRGLKEGVVTTSYPKRPDGYGDSYKGALRVSTSPPAAPEGDSAAAAQATAIASCCPTGAIEQHPAQEGLSGQPHLSVDRGRCILCGICVQSYPELFYFEPSTETSKLARHSLVVPEIEEGDAQLSAVRADLARRVKALRRSVHIRHVDAGSDGSEEWEVAALLNPVYDIHRLGLFFTASPRHADLLLVTGTGTAGMAGPLKRTYEAMPYPKIVMAAGTDAISGGIVHPTYSTHPGIAGLVPVDIWVPGSPPSPFAILHGILAGLGLLSRSCAAKIARQDAVAHGPSGSKGAPR